MPKITVTHTFVDSATGEKSSEPLPVHIECIAAALLKEMREVAATDPNSDEQIKAI